MKKQGTVWLWIWLALIVPQQALAVSDAILGVDSATGVTEALNPTDAAALIGATGTAGLDGNFDVTGGNIITGADESKQLQIRGTGGQSTSGVNIYQHSSGKLVIKCVVSNVEGACDIVQELASGKVWQVKNSGATVIFKIDEATGKVTTLTVDGEDSGVSITLYKKLCGGDLVGVDPATGTAGHIWNKDPLSTAPTAVAVTGTNRSTGYARHPDSDGDFGVQLSCDLPTGFTGNLDAIVWWTTAGTGNARIQVATKCYADDAADDAAFNTASKFTLAAGTASRPQRDVITNITQTGCSAANMLRLRVFRNRTEASDTLASGTFDVEKFELWSRHTF